MGSSCCLGFWRSDNKTGRSSTPSESSSLLRHSGHFDVTQALVELPPNVFVNRVDPAPPSCCLSAAMFLSLQSHLPLHVQHRKWLLLYGSEEHGFSFNSMRHQIEQVTATTRLRAGAVLLVVAGGATFGAYLSRLPIVGGKVHCGTNETFVFRVYPTGVVKCYPSALAVTGAGNEYYTRCALDTETLSIGGGGAGPAILLTDDMNTVVSSTSCPTFHEYETLLDVRGESVVLEGGEPRCPVLRIELWAIADKTFFRPK